MKLLHKTLRAYIIFSIVVLLIAAPLFYFLTEKLFIEDADEALFLHRKEVIRYNLPTMKIADIKDWNKISRDIKILDKNKYVTNDSLSFKFFFDSLANENEPYRVLMSRITIEEKPYTLMARVNLIESEDLILNLALLFCLTLTLLLAGLYLITRALSLKLWLPFYSTLDKMEHFELEKNIKPEFAETDVEEFIRLNSSINRLLDNNISVFKSQHDFIENAAHELQTPLATLQAKLDTLVQQIPLNNELGQTLSKLNETISRLNRINKNLLLLSKIENNLYKSFDRIEVNTMIQKQLEFFTEQAVEKNIVFEVKRLEHLTIEANEALVEIAISNLLLNAVRHNVQNGQIKISLNGRTLSVANTSNSESLDRQKLYKRFSSLGVNGGSGLGLAIVDKISKTNGWDLQYIFENNYHIFSITF